jgi:sugar phosphate isomerase/epimerase
MEADMKIGYCMVNASGKPAEEAVRMAAEKGYECIEIPSYVDNGQVDAKVLLKSGNAAKFRSMVEESGMFISAVSNHADSLMILGPHSSDTDFIFKGTPEQKIKFGTDSLLDSIKLANALEVPVVVAFTGMENFAHAWDWPSATAYLDEDAKFVERFVPILDKAQEYGVKLAFEPHPNNVIYDIHSALRIIEAADKHPALGINLDPANMLYLGISMEEFVDCLGDRIFCVHAKDAQIVKHNVMKGGMLMQGEWGRKDKSFRFRVPGWGDVNWKSLISELYLSGYDYVFNYEHEDVIMSVQDGLEKAIDFLRPLMIKAPYEGRQDKIFMH